MSVYIFTRKELKEKKASNFNQGDLIRVGKYGIYIYYHDGNHEYDIPGLLSKVENLNTNKFLGWMPGIDRPYYIDDFLGR